MLTDYFSELSEVKCRLDIILDEELQRRSELDFPSPEQAVSQLLIL